MATMDIIAARFKYKASLTLKELCYPPAFSVESLVSAALVFQTF